MKSQVNGTLHFLDVLVSKKSHGSFSHRDFSKKMQTEYIHCHSHHHPWQKLRVHASSHRYNSQKLGILNRIVTHALRVLDKDHLKDEKPHLLNVFEYIRSQCFMFFKKQTKFQGLRKILGIWLPMFNFPLYKEQFTRFLSFLGSMMFHPLSNPWTQSKSP